APDYRSGPAEPHRPADGPGPAGPPAAGPPAAGRARRADGLAPAGARGSALLPDRGALQGRPGGPTAPLPVVATTLPVAATTHSTIRGPGSWRGACRQEVPAGTERCLQIQCPGRDLDPRREVFKASALPTELPGRRLVYILPVNGRGNFS